MAATALLYPTCRRQGGRCSKRQYILLFLFFVAILNIGNAPAATAAAWISSPSLINLIPSSSNMYNKPIGGGRCCYHFVVAAAAKRDENDEEIITSEEMNNNNKKKEGNLFRFLADPLGSDSNIPDEYKEEIYRAEGNTKAAQERGNRIALYTVIAVLGIGCAFFNAFLTELRNPSPSLEDTVNGVTTAAVATTTNNLADLGFDWVQSNMLFSFLFLNKIGGGLALIVGAGTGLLAELEFDSRRKNAEAIWEELQARKKKQKTNQQPQSQDQQRGTTSGKRKKRQGSKEAKRMAALSEVVDIEDSTTTSSVIGTTSSSTQKDVVDVVNKEPSKDENKDKSGILQTLQGFYEKADAMAASQALLLNKQLEDAGVLEKITDESGLKVIGRDAAAAKAHLQEDDETKPKAAKAGTPEPLAASEEQPT